MDYCHACRRHLNGALACAGCGTPVEALRYETPHIPVHTPDHGHGEPDRPALYDERFAAYGAQDRFAAHDERPAVHAVHDERFAAYGAQDRFAAHDERPAVHAVHDERFAA
ncbi:SCO2400 family protein, partial [Streptomyces tanashiensis]|uniref:SCO2400 family protein n=1 Tax=Streptomyces tanashiensis TaxID=67367 RepID=UPI0034885E1D